MDFWYNLFNGQGFMPRRLCGDWDPSLIRLHIFSDVTIWLAYLWIPLVMLWSYRVHKRTLRLHVPTLLILLLYVVFITACGWTHFFDALMFYNPVYRVNGLVRAVTAVVSFATAVSLVRLFPLAISAPVTILTQQAALKEQFAWLRDILDSVTNGVLKLCANPSELPSAPARTDAPAAPRSIPITSASDLRQVRIFARGLASAANFDSARTNDLLSAAHEAAMNALRHAGGGVVHGFESAHGVQIRVEDHGPGIPLGRLPIATLKQGYSTLGTAGQGWFLVLSLVDRAHLLTGPHGTTLVLEMERAASPNRLVPFSARVGGDVAAA